MKNLTEFKKYLALPDAAIRLVKYETMRDGEFVSVPPKNPNYRGVMKLQTNSVKLEGGSWLTFGKASEWQFDHDASRAVNTTQWSRMTYTWANLMQVECDGCGEWANCRGIYEGGEMYYNCNACTNK